jgi:pimeloyl-ACP methyl ester carboxylesterase
MRTILRSVVHDANLGRSDGHPVLILPGLAADDWSTAPLRWAVRSQGYWAHGWRLGRNVGPTARVVAGLRVRVEQLRRAHGRRVSVVGWSLGGVNARALARERPQLVRQVITLGSPYRSYENSPPLLAVPATSIYTRTDGVTSWELCIDRAGPRAENIEVYGTHIGLGVNPTVILAVLDRLGQPEDDWSPFRPPWWAHCSYPEPESWSTDDRRSA